MSLEDSYVVATLVDSCKSHEDWIVEHEKKSKRHTLYFYVLVVYVALDMAYKVYSAC